MLEGEVFSGSYPEARAKFLAAARTSGARLTHYRHPRSKGGDGEDLYLDVAVLGPPRASRVLTVVSGTHGIEGFAGSAVQTEWMRSGASRRLPADLAVVFVHACNPWGFSHRTRVTEENVDLNRNFVDFSVNRPTNPGYDALHALLTPPVLDEETFAGIFGALDEFRARVVEQAFSDAFNAGQYSHPDGHYFGGERPQWSATTFLEAVRAHVGHAAEAAVIDLHTGLGPYLGHVFLCFHDRGSGGYERARRWWGERAVSREGVTHKAVAVYQGLLVDAFARALPDARTTGVVVEFGTLARPEMQRALLVGRWLRFEGSRDPQQAEALRPAYEQAYYPADERWRRAVIDQAREIIAQAVAGLADA